MDLEPRRVQQIVEPETVLEGAGVKLKRSIAGRVLDYVDPFLLFDHFGSDNPTDYLAGFPMHPHRGIETVTYMLAGEVNHRDSIGNAGTIGAGDVQWMTAGRGILHEEMPKPCDGEMAGFQLWVNLPARHKMTQPRYQEIASDQVPKIVRDDGLTIRVIAGEAEGVRGPVTEIVAAPTYLDVSIPAGGSLVHPIQRGHSAFAYVFEGEGTFGGMAHQGGTAHERGTTVGHPKLVVFGDGDYVEVGAADHPVRFLLVSGEPSHERIVRYGPFVMNTWQEIEETLRELQAGTFV
jgi:redox-sensitive bicupin YhaK (pirin superfamily)